MNTVITDAKLALEYDENSMRLDQIDPELNRMGNRITFGNIHPNEKKTVAIFSLPASINRCSRVSWQSWDII